MEFVSNLYKEDGRVVIQCNIRDITERKRTEELLAHKLEELRVTKEHLAQQNLELEHKQARYQELFDFAPDAYVVTDLRGHIQQVNQAGRQLFGQGSAFLHKLPLVQFVAPQDKSAVRSLLSRFRQNQARQPTRVLGRSGPAAWNAPVPLRVAG